MSMKLIRAIIRPESTQRVIDALEKNSIYAMHYLLNDNRIAYVSFYKFKLFFL